MTDQPTPRTEALTQASEQLIRDWDRYPDAIDANELSARLWLIERQAKAQARTETLPDPSWCDCDFEPIRGIKAGRHLPSCRYGIVLDYLDIHDPRATR